MAQALCGPRAILIAAVAALSACTTVDTELTGRLSPGTSDGWALSAVEVEVPEALTVSSDPNSLIPREDIVWYEEPEGDRRAQVGKIVADAITDAAAGLDGAQPVILDVTLERFHALTPMARMRPYGGTHTVTFSIQVVDAATGTVLSAPGRIQADVRAVTGKASMEALAAGESQKSLISGRVSDVVETWLGNEQPGVVEGTDGYNPGD
ncbi:MAG: DUF6778 family protein [Pseudomonadota bacterium]